MKMLQKVLALYLSSWLLFAPAAISATQADQSAAQSAPPGVKQTPEEWQQLVLYCGTVALAQNASEPKNPTIAMRATHILGLEGARDNASGALSIQGDALQFHKDGKPAVEIKIDSIQDVFVGEQSREIGGVPMTLGKAAAPYGGGRVVSLFARKKYDTVSVPYVDADGGVHGVIFQLNKGQGEVFRSELVSHGAHVSVREGEHAKQSAAEVVNESK